MIIQSLDPSQNDNDLTLRSYQDKTREYIEGTPPLDDALKAWIDACLKLIPRDGNILEIGSGFGRDAAYIQARGFAIECSDAVPNFVDLLKKKGFEAHALNVLRDTINGAYDMVFADAVMLHFNPDEAAHVTNKVHAVLKDAGIFALRVKRGNGAAWTEEKLGAPRYVYYWQPEELRAMLADCGFEWADMTENYTRHNDVDWIGVIARKES